jgi:phthiodiolone/phenolphthiodiolone dimycocerosates ketoreductase
VIHAAGEDAGRSMKHFMATQTMLLVLGDDRGPVIEQAMQSLYVAYNTLGLAGAVWRKHGLDHPMGDDFAGQIELVPAATPRELVETAMERMTPELLLEQYYFGSPDQIADAVAPLVDAGCRHFVLANMGGNFTGRGSADFASMATLTERLKNM